MRRGAVLFAIVTLVAMGFSAGMTAVADEYRVTVTNLTRGQQFTPILVVSHTAGVKLFELGDPASMELEILAEGGATGPLESLLLGMSRQVLDTDVGGGLLDPGDSKTMTVDTAGRANRVSVAAMLIPTNDAFFAVNGVRGPNGNQELVLFSPAYDAGSEVNDESCTTIPGPVCGGVGYDPAGGEGPIFVHAGIHGIGELETADFDWRNPVARISIVRVDEDDEDDD